MKRLWIPLFVILTAAAAANDGFVFSEGGTLTTLGDVDFVAMSKLQPKYGDHFLWISRAGKTYLIRDDAALGRAQELLKPQRELQAKRVDIAARYTAVDREFTKYAREQAELADRLSRLSPARDEAEVSELQSKLQALSAKMRETSTQQDGLREELHSLMVQQEKLVPELMKTLGAFADDAIAKGVAKAK